MSYIERNLMDNEQIFYKGKLHWVIFILPIICFIIGMVSFSADITFVGGMFGILAVLTGMHSFFIYKTSEFGITNERVIVKIGLIRRKSVEILLKKVEGVEVDQSIMGRILGFGSITIIGTGGTRDPFDKISNPLKFRKKAQEQILAMDNEKVYE